MLSDQNESGVAVRELQQAQSLQLPLLLRAISSAEESQDLAPLVPLIEKAHRLLKSTSVSDVDGAQGLHESECYLHPLRDAISALYHVFRGNFLHVKLCEGDDAVRSSNGIIGAFGSAACGMLTKDAICTGSQGLGLLGKMISEVHEDITQALNCFSIATAAAASASASVASLSSSLEQERIARAAVDIKIALLQRECQKLRDELVRSSDIVAAESSSSKAQIQAISSQLILLQVTRFILPQQCELLC
jgi:hypothetical protein